MNSKTKPEKIIALATAVALDLAKDATACELVTLKSFFGTVTNVLSTLHIERLNCKK